MTGQELVATNDLWFQLLEWLKNNCSTKGLTFRQISDYEIELNRNHVCVLSIRLTPDSPRPLVYELEDGTLRELGIVVTSEGQAFFRLYGVSYNAHHMGSNILKVADDGL